METNLNLVTKAKQTDNLVIITSNLKFIDKNNFSDSETKYIEKCIKKEDEIIYINQYNRSVYILFNKKTSLSSVNLEKTRKNAEKLCTQINKHDIKEITIVSFDLPKETIIAFAEGILLANYQFLKHLTKLDKKKNSLSIINLLSSDFNELLINELRNIIESVYLSRDLINEPLSHLNAVDLSNEILNTSKSAGFSATIFDKKKIEKLKMGGLLAVNKGSVDPPTFSILEWKPKEHKNKKPIVLVGKGIVYDTGGLSLKPTSNSMDYMKSDMSGAAAVLGVFNAIAKNNLPFYVIGLIPATDNRPSGNAYAPGDIIEMYDGTTVEMLNADAEGRMILADALSYAKTYDPEIVIDIATLTGAAAAAIGKYGIVTMGNAKEKTFDKLEKAGQNVYERIVRFPFWEEYDELLKSDIADLKNIGGSQAGAITAGKFLEHFTDYDWIHLDIAGSAYMSTKDSYRGIGGTGVGVRLFYDFIKNY
ncbi:MAG TPA: peptidase M17 [Bacteroidales bacterium]|nr:MAG: peptidase M17 [Bacteroidetes bacterium GWF2_33_38]OFY76289.1 MAG: peptidase M17 [Bacteroidetes bacterium RIFOXYA12_FULL_33_9]OFY89711.1 MAG: peptidase M17 [Bacteroidetes bacterium RIFOXYA2_FULL_33_7]HBF88065.1 peptidase M17 [Bacteroidales bacterium]